MGRKSGIVISKLDSRSEGRGFESHPILDGNGVKAMPGSIPVHPILVHSIHEKKENIGSQMGHTKKKHFKKPKKVSNLKNKVNYLFQVQVQGRQNVGRVPEEEVRV